MICTVITKSGNRYCSPERIEPPAPGSDIITFKDARGVGYVVFVDAIEAIVVSEG
jgi:hypothetical protein